MGLSWYSRTPHGEFGGHASTCAVAPIPLWGIEEQGVFSRPMPSPSTAPGVSRRALPKLMKRTQVFSYRLLTRIQQEPSLWYRLSWWWVTAVRFVAVPVVSTANRGLRTGQIRVFPWPFGHQPPRGEAVYSDMMLYKQYIKPIATPQSFLASC
jgi:hypothetical protein